MIRLTADMWVSAYLARLRLADIPAYVIAKGDLTAGAVIVKLNTLDGKATAFSRTYDMLEDRRRWDVLAEGEERVVDEALQRQRKFDPDLWVIELESRDGITLLDQPGLSE